MVCVGSHMLAAVVSELWTHYNMNPVSSTVFAQIVQFIVVMFLL